MDTKQRYEELKKKYNLPEYEDINRNFDIEDLHENSKILLSKIRIKILEKLEYYSHHLSMSIQPDSDLNLMFEAKYTDDKMREKAFLIYKKFMRLIRKANMVSIDNSEEENAHFIKESYAEWHENKEELKSHFNKLIAYWKTSIDVKGDLNYFG